ncbi:MAG: alkaline phosphatase D family protein [Halieaceae bacterium]|jgi:alkaline phosphatase D|nr:alkaline phosphatase D family protein [Halieaceae bacterium]
MTKKTPPGHRPGQATTDQGRRRVIKGFAAGSLLPLLGANLLACSDNDRDSVPREPGVAASFRHGVASGDPLENRVIIWTRATPETEGTVQLRWEVASDEAFSNIVASGRGSTSADTDYTAKVDVQGLSPGSEYYYRFFTGETASPTGRTRTLPAAGVTAVSFAVLSCSNYPAGFFNVYKEVAKADVDAVLHLGDYIYEYGADGYATGRAEEFGRQPQPPGEITRLSDYRTRYAQYRSDGDLQSAHAAHPFIVVWDDHEICNDTWKAGAQNHQPDAEGDFQQRVQAALQAWYEWMPIRPVGMDDQIIYRQFQYGDLVDLLMLDTRLVGRDEQLRYSDLSDQNGINVEAARAAIADSRRSLLGATQSQWLNTRLTQSTATWQVLGQQVLMGRYDIPARILENLNPWNNPDIEAGKALLRESVAAKTTAVAERTPAQQALLDSAIPNNLDAWGGYAFSRDELMDQAREAGARLVSFAGDTHNAWASQLTDAQGNIVGVELATSSVSSPGLESFLGEETALRFEAAMVTLIDGLHYTNLRDRGYLLATFTPTSVTARWRFVSNTDSTTYTLLDDRAYDLTVFAADMRLG